jgi:unsaturated rhamnogalacturonyl hydrolase
MIFIKNPFKQQLSKFLRIGLLVILLAIIGLQNSFSQNIREISSRKKWSERMALSIIKNNPQSWMLDFSKKPVWSYPQGLILLSFEKLYRKNNEQLYFDYIKSYADTLINEKGVIRNYTIEGFNIDMVNAGKILFYLYEKTRQEKYKVAIETLRNQLRWQPRTTEGGFWHKLRYPWQMWLDGAYMGTPFLAQYAHTFNDPQAFDDAANQLILMEKHLRDPATGLLYHGWDESRIQKWANPETGTSPHFWGRAIGWYSMAIVDALEYFPQNHPKRKELIDIWQGLASALEKYQDKQSGLWYQVVDQGNREGNYLEASASCMFVYALAKGVNNGYLDKKYKQVAEKGFKGITTQLIEVKKNGEVLMHKVCEVAGLGGQPYRSGSYEYYVNEKIRTNDGKATGPFIMASLELGY